MTTNLLWTGRHDRTAFLCAKICDGAIQHVDLVEEIHSWGGGNKPFRLNILESKCQEFQLE